MKLKGRQWLVPLVTALAVTLYIAGSPLLTRSLGVMLWLSLVGLTLAAAGYCIARAKEHLTPEWHDMGARSRLWRSWSWSVEDYDAEGRRWLWSWRFTAAIWVVLWLVGGAFM